MIIITPCNWYYKMYYFSNTESYSPKSIVLQDGCILTECDTTLILNYCAMHIPYSYMVSALTLKGDSLCIISANKVTVQKVRADGGSAGVLSSITEDQGTK